MNLMMMMITMMIIIIMTTMMIMMMKNNDHDHDNDDDDDGTCDEKKKSKIEKGCITHPVVSCVQCLQGRSVASPTELMRAPVALFIAEVSRKWSRIHRKLKITS